MSYSYPFSEEWTREEIIDVVNFFNLVEAAYETGVNRDDLLLAYTRFKQIVPAKSEEKTYFNEFERASTYAVFKAVQAAGKSDKVKFQIHSK